MKYIVYKRFKGKAFCGEINLPAMTEVENQNGVIFYGKDAICLERSENAYQYFARNNDSNGILRGKLVQAIQKTLNKHDENYQKRWDRVWDDEVCRTYKRKEYDDYWLWNHDFFNADINTLRHIAKLIGVKESL